LQFRNEIPATDAPDEPRAALPDEVKRLGDHPIVVAARIGSATVEVAARDEDPELLRGLSRQSAEAVVGAQPLSTVQCVK
jgi:hypothetical protein